MTSDEKEALMTFVLRHANLTLLDRILGEGIFDRVDREVLTKEDRDYLFYLARHEEIGALKTLQEHPGPRLSDKIDRFLRNIKTVQEILA